MSQSEQIVLSTERLVKQAEAIFEERDPTRRQSLPLDEPVRDTSETPKWANNLRDVALGLYRYAHDFKGSDPDAYGELGEQLKRVKQLLAWAY